MPAQQYNTKCEFYLIAEYIVMISFWLEQPSVSDCKEPENILITNLSNYRHVWDFLNIKYLGKLLNKDMNKNRISPWKS